MHTTLNPQFIKYFQKLSVEQQFYEYFLYIIKLAFISLYRIVAFLCYDEQCESK